MNANRPSETRHASLAWDSMAATMKTVGNAAVFSHINCRRITFSAPPRQRKCESAIPLGRQTWTSSSMTR